MYLLEARAMQFQRAKGITAQVQARHLGVKEEEFKAWLKNPALIPVDYGEKVFSYFKMQPHELGQKVMVQVPFELLLEMRGQISHIVPQNEDEADCLFFAESEMDKLIKSKEIQLFGKG